MAITIPGKDTNKAKLAFGLLSLFFAILIVAGIFILLVLGPNNSGARLFGVFLLILGLASGSIIFPSYLLNINYEYVFGETSLKIKYIHKNKFLTKFLNSIADITNKISARPTGEIPYSIMHHLSYSPETGLYLRFNKWGIDNPKYLPCNINAATLKKIKDLIKSKNKNIKFE